MTYLQQLKNLLRIQEQQLRSISSFKQCVNIHYKITQLRKMIKKEEEMSRIKYESDPFTILDKKHFL